MFKLFRVLLVILCISIIDVVYGFSHGLHALLSPDQHALTPRLEDFFWTGSGDGPPPPPEPPDLTPSQPSPAVHTTTVLATVYLDSYPPQAVTDPTTGECSAHCGGIPDSLEPEVPDDRRYWLLTVIQGAAPDSLQLRLARLYQKAFLRQQERHLGIIKSLDAPTTRKKHEVHSFVVNKDFKVESSDSELPFPHHNDPSSIPVIEPTRVLPSIANTILNRSSSFEEVSPDMFKVEVNVSSQLEIKPTKLSEMQWILATVRKREVTTDGEEISEEGKEELIDIPLEADSGNETILFKREIIKPDQQPPVQVHIQNITELSETGSIEIVYVVLVGGRAVPAAVAARDMRLVRDAEVAKELGATVTTKAEPAYLKAAEGLAGEAAAGGVRGAELWALAVGAAVAVLLVLLLVVLLCRLVRRKKTMSAASLRAYRNELLREAERNQLKQVHEEKDGRLISVVSPSRTRPSSTLLPIYRAASASSTSTTSSGVSEVAAALRRRQKKPHALRIAQKKRVGTTDSLLEAAGIDSSDSAKELSVPNTPTSYLSMPSVRSFPRGNTVEPLSKVLEPISVRHLDIDSSGESTKEPRTEPASKTPQDRGNQDTVPRRQMSSQLVRLGSIGKDPGVIGPLVWDLHCQRIKNVPQPSPSRSSTHQPGVSRMRQRFNELVDDAFSLFNSDRSNETYTVDEKHCRNDGGKLTQARNENVRLPGSPYSALDTVRGKSAGVRAAPPRSRGEAAETQRPRTSAARPPDRRPPPARAWDATPSHSLTSSLRLQRPAINPAFILAEAKLPPEDPALPLISAIKSEIHKVRQNAKLPDK